MIRLKSLLTENEQLGDVAVGQLVKTEKPLKVKIIGGGKNKDAWYQDYIGKIFTVYKGNETLAKSFGYEFLYEVLKNDEYEKTLGREVRKDMIAPDAAEEI